MAVPVNRPSCPPSAWRARPAGRRAPSLCPGGDTPASPGTVRPAPACSHARPSAQQSLDCAPRSALRHRRCACPKRSVPVRGRPVATLARGAHARTGRTRHATGERSIGRPARDASATRAAGVATASNVRCHGRRPGNRPGGHAAWHRNRPRMPRGKTSLTASCGGAIVRRAEAPGALGPVTAAARAQHDSTQERTGAEPCRQDAFRLQSPWPHC